MSYMQPFQPQWKTTGIQVEIWSVIHAHGSSLVFWHWRSSLISPDTKQLMHASELFSIYRTNALHLNTTSFQITTCLFMCVVLFPSLVMAYKPSCVSPVLLFGLPTPHYPVSGSRPCHLPPAVFRSKPHDEPGRSCLFSAWQLCVDSRPNTVWPAVVCTVGRVLCKKGQFQKLLVHCLAVWFVSWGQIHLWHIFHTLRAIFKEERQK